MENLESSIEELKECCTCHDVKKEFTSELVDISFSIAEIFERLDALETQVREINGKMSGITTCMNRCVNIFEMNMRGR